MDMQFEKRKVMLTETILRDALHHEADFVHVGYQGNGGGALGALLLANQVAGGGVADGATALQLGFDDGTNVILKPGNTGGVAAFF